MKLCVCEAVPDAINISSFNDIIPRWVQGHTRCRAVGPAGITFEFTTSEQINIGDLIDVDDRGQWTKAAT